MSAVVLLLNHGRETQHAIYATSAFRLLPVRVHYEMFGSNEARHSAHQ